jgi:hypothetical protein
MLWIATVIAIQVKAFPWYSPHLTRKEKLDMRAKLLLCVIGSATFLACTAGAAEMAKSTTERTSVFAVRLQCKAAPELACGGQTKELLIELERNPAVAQAWLNTRGSALLVIGTENSTPESRAEAVGSTVVKMFKRQVEELEGEGRDKVLDSFRSGSGWYRSEGADELSRRIAKIVAARLVRHTRERARMSAAKAANLETALSDVLQVSFVQDPRGDPSPDLLRVAHAHLDKRGFSAFKEALALGLDPEPGEK